MVDNIETVSGDYGEDKYGRCIECKCAVGEDWGYVDCTNKEFIECPQCGEIYETSEMQFQRTVDKNCTTCVSWQSSAFYSPCAECVDMSGYCMDARRDRHV